MSDTKKLGLGLIGVGNIGRIHLIAIAALIESNLIDMRLEALCDIDSEQLQSSSELFEIKKTYEDYKELVKDPHVDIVYVCTPTNLHIDMVRAAAKAGKNVFCEKPLAHSSPQASDLVATIRAAGVKAGIGLVLRYNQFLLYAKRILEEKDFGKPIVAHIRDDQHFPVNYEYYSYWRGEKSIAGGGTLIEHSIHDVDVLRWFFGDIKSVFAKVRFVSEREVEDHASLVMTHVDGTISTLDSVWHSVDRPNERYMEFFFENGYIGIRLESDKCHLDYHLNDECPVRIWEETANDALLNDLGLNMNGLSESAIEAITSLGTHRYGALNYAFLKAIEGNEIPSPNFLDAVAAHKIVDAAYESSNKGRSVDPL